MSASPVDVKGKARASLNGTDSDATVTLMSASSVTLSDDNDDIDSDSASDSSNDSDESTSDDDSEEDEDLSSEYMASLLEKARENARAKKREEEASEATFENDASVIKLGGDDKLAQLPTLSLQSLPPSYFEPSSETAGPSKFRNPEIERALAQTAHLSAPAPPVAPHTILSKKQRQALKAKTAGPAWFDLPAPAEADLPQLYREVEALRLRNQLDPKRFYRKDEGEGKSIKGLPKHFAIGTIVETRSPFAPHTAKEGTSRKRTLVDELMDDAEARSYAKKKFRELQAVRGARGKGTLAKRKQARREKW